MRKFIFFGLGISAFSAIKFLLKNGDQIWASDDNAHSIADLEQKIKNQKELEKYLINLHLISKIDEINWQDADFLILAPSIHFLYHPHKIIAAAKAHNCKVICDIELFYFFNPQSRYIGITGTNGKSTTTALTSHIFKSNKIESAMGGNIGIACFDLPNLSENGTYIFELSSYQLDLINKAHFNITILLNITPDHIDHHGNMSAYIAAKQRVFKNQKQGDFAIISIDDENCLALYNQLKNDHNFAAKLIPISTKKIIPNGVAVLDTVVYNTITGKEEKFELGFLPQLRGEHNAQNISAAFAAASLSGIVADKIIAAIKTFIGLKHRIQFVGKIGNINFINDSKATNADSTAKALRIYDNIYWILGGQAKEGGIEELEPYFSRINCAFLIGTAAEDFAKILDKNKIKYHQSADLKTAVQTAYNLAQNDQDGREKNILLSPACASFDQWKNFEERGDYFSSMAESIIKKSF